MCGGGPSGRVGGNIRRSCRRASVPGHGRRRTAHPHPLKETTLIQTDSWRAARSATRLCSPCSGWPLLATARHPPRQRGQEEEAERPDGQGDEPEPVPGRGPRPGDQRARHVCGAIDAGGQILNDVDASNFPERAKLLAAGDHQTRRPTSSGCRRSRSGASRRTPTSPATPATEVRYDFLQPLLDELAARGANYKVAVVQDEFDQELPADRDGSDATQDTSFPLCGADEDGRLTMRDAILVERRRAR